MQKSQEESNYQHAPYEQNVNQIYIKLLEGVLEIF